MDAERTSASLGDVQQLRSNSRMNSEEAALLRRRFISPALTLTGIDVSPAMLEVARQHLPEATLIEADAALLPLADASADLITCVTGFACDPGYRRRTLRVASAAATGWSSRRRSSRMGEVGNRLTSTPRIMGRSSLRSSLLRLRHCTDSRSRVRRSGPMVSVTS